MDKKLVVYKANKLVEAKYTTLTLQEQLLILACIATSNPLTLTAQTPVELSVSDFAVLAGVTHHDAYADLREVVERLYNRSVTIDNPDPDDPALTYTRTRWVSSINYYSGEGRIRLYFAPRILPYLAQLKDRFTRYELRHITRFRSQYGVRLYELLVQWQCRGERNVQLDWLRAAWGLETIYPKIEVLKRKVLTPAIRDINEFSNLWVKYTQRKAGRRVVAFIFTFGLKADIAKPKRSRSGTSKLTHAYIERHAKPGETWDEALIRLTQR